MKPSFLISVISLALLVQISADELVVKLNHGGKILGSIKESQRGRKFFAFTGIPFAEPPTGERRFQPPVPKAPWHGSPLDATADGSACVQVDPTSVSGPTLFGEEDCLFLNIYTPEIPRSENSEFSKKAVLVWIHGGGYYFGHAASTLYGPGRIMDDPNIILVAMNYRLGALGFLSTNDDVSRGNYGMMDQALALQWVHDHIEVFGGDKNHVTIFGESAGGASVGHHLLSPMSAGLFQSAVSISGSPLCDWAFKKDPMYWAKKLAERLDCSTESSSKLVECLKKIPAVDIVQKTMEIMSQGLMTSVIFSPSLDGKFLLHSPRDIMESGNLPSKVPLITGVNRDETLTFYLGVQKNHPEANLASKEVIYRLINKMLDDKGNSPDVTKLYVDEYLTSVDLNNVEETREAVIKMMSHAMFVMGHYETVALRTRYGLPTYAYELEYDPSLGFNELMQSELKGVSHADDLFLTFDGPLFGLLKPNANDQKIIDVIRELWTNLARFGNPTPNTSELLHVRWELAADGKFKIYNIDNPITTTTFDISKEKLFQFWISQVQKALKSKKMQNKDEL